MKRKPIPDAKVIERMKFWQEHRWKIGIPLLIFSVTGFIAALWYDHYIRHLITSLPTIEVFAEKHQAEQAEIERNMVYISGYKMGFWFGMMTVCAQILFSAGIAFLVKDRRTAMLIRYYDQAVGALPTNTSPTSHVNIEQEAPEQKP